MTVAVMMETLMAVSAKLDNLWSMYIVVHLGILWFLFLVHRPLLVVERLIALLAYAGFVAVNGRALIHSYGLAESIRIDLITQFGKELVQAPETMRFLSERAAGTHPQGAENFIMISHAVALAFVALLLIFRNNMIRYYHKLYPEFAAKNTVDL
jgi:hypothetical protein